MSEKKTIIVGIGDYKVINNQTTILKTIALGSCVSVILFCSNTNITAMSHIALPYSKINPDKALKMPGYFVDTAIKSLLKEIKQLGFNGKISAKLIGGASILDDNKLFDIGNRNIIVVKKILQILNIPILSEDIGGRISRTVTINSETKKIFISNNEKMWEL